MSEISDATTGVDARESADKRLVALVKNDYADLVRSSGYRINGIGIRSNDLMLHVKDMKFFRWSRYKSFDRFAKTFPEQYCVEGSDGNMKAYNFKVLLVTGSYFL